VPSIDDVNSDLFEGEGEEKSPDPGLAVTLAKALNYTFERAISDLVDNSIANNASNIWIYIDEKDGIFESPRAFVAIVDDGEGLSEKDLVAKLEYGYDSDDESKNLGAFGLGLKTASTSQSWVVAVSTRQSKNDEFIRRAWDIPWIKSVKKKWTLRIPKEEIFPDKIMEKISESSGTAVLLPDLSRMKDNMNELSSYNQSQVLVKKYADLCSHMSIVFHRFLSGKCLSEEYSGKQLNIFVNDEPLEPWDPFCSDHEKHVDHKMKNPSTLTHLSPNHDESGSVLQLSLHGLEMEFRMHILPKFEEWSDEFTIASGIKGWVAHQGVYFYRLDRMIQLGGWCGLVKNEVKNQLARLSIDVGREWDEIISLTATKDRIIVPEIEGNTFRKDFRKIFGEHRSAARRVYEADYDVGSRGGTGRQSGGGQSGGGQSGGGQSGGGQSGGGQSSGGQSGGGQSSGGQSGGGQSSGGQSGGGQSGRRTRRKRLDQSTVDALIEVADDDEKAVIIQVWRKATRRRR
jgi:hypothetical protein